MRENCAGTALLRCAAAAAG